MVLPGGLLMMQRTWLALWALSLASCTGVIDGAEPGTDPDAPGMGMPGPSPSPNSGAPAGAAGVAASAACQETPPDAPLRRLTAAQYRNTVRDLIAFAVKDDKLAAAALAALQPALEG